MNQTIVTSCEEDVESDDDERSISTGRSSESTCSNDGRGIDFHDILNEGGSVSHAMESSIEKSKTINDDLMLFDAEADEEDEAYVYRYLRSGLPEKVPVRTVPTTVGMSPSTDATSSSCPDPTAKQQHQQQSLTVLKPRDSDAVLSCPCCFQIVCMDCQQHERYTTQYRAMFVMGVAVRWDWTLRYNVDARCLVRIEEEEKEKNQRGQPETKEETIEDAVPRRDEIPMVGWSEIPNMATDNEQQQQQCEAKVARESKQQHELQPDSEKEVDDSTIYYTVCCAHCETVVAALDMTDEVYHFSGCLASS